MKNERMAAKSRTSHPAELPATNQRRLRVVLSVRFALTCARFLEFNCVPFSDELVYGHLGKEVSK